MLRFGKKKQEMLSAQDGDILLNLARHTILEELGCASKPAKQLNKAAKLLQKECRGTFVTLHKHGQLRGCIGNIEPVKSIFQSVKDNAAHAAFNDSRFSPLSEDEVEEIEIEVSILTKPEKLDYKNANDLVSKLRPGIDGVIVSKDRHKSTFLPQVWDNLKKPEDFLEQLCLKAGLPMDSWASDSLDIFTYQVQFFEE